jgi:hypothetical protein
VPSEGREVYPDDSSLMTARELDWNYRGVPLWAHLNSRTLCKLDVCRGFFYLRAE